MKGESVPHLFGCQSGSAESDPNPQGVRGLHRLPGVGAPVLVEINRVYPDRTALWLPDDSSLTGIAAGLNA